MNDEASMTSQPSPSRDVTPVSTGEEIILDETIHQPTRLRIMTLLVSVQETDRLAYGFIQQTLRLTGGNLTVHLRKLEAAGLVTITKEFQGVKPRTWVQATPQGRRAFAEYLSNLERALGVSVRGVPADDGQAGSQ